MSEIAAYAMNGQPCSREAFYAAACDPQRPIVVQACAGAGKTWMLVSRIVRALLAGSEPQEILAITFTKKAAGEMRERLQEWLFEFSSADDAKLVNELVIRGISSEIARSPAKNLRELLSNLYQKTLHNPRSVQIRTFHSWFAQLLRSAPLAVLQSLGLPSPYELLEDDEQAVDELWPRFHALLLKDVALHQVYREAVQEVGRWGVQTALENALAKRVEFELADKAGVVSRSIRPMAEVFPAFAGFDDPLQKFAQEKLQLLSAAKLLAAATQKTYAAKGVELLEALGNDAWASVPICLLTQKDEPRKFSDKMAGIDEIRAAQELCVSVSQAQQQHAAWQHQQRMATLCRAMNACFAEVKRERGWVDMGDLERAALHLLSDDALSGWVQQRLDAQIKHLLIDEFQDTNPLQWQALQTWLSGYAGAGSAAPSVFIVGDAKQSIYRFRRAEPQVFEAATRFVCEGLGGTLLACDHTRRNAQGVMNAVNALMTQASTELPYDFRIHTTESSEAGRVLRLPLVPRVEKLEASTELIWRDTLTEPRDDPEEHAVDTECELAARWLAAQIAGGVASQDIMVLARQRDRLSRMRDALRALGIASQIAEKTPLIDQPEVQDVVALLDALVTPSNNLALARALKSPLFAWSDDDLIDLAQAARSEEGIGRSWLNLLLNQEHFAQYLCRRNAHFASKTAQKISQMQHWLQTLPPHDALSNIYDTYALVECFMAATPAPLRGRVQLSLQALLHAALETKSGRFLTPHDWVRHLKKAHLKTPQAANPSAVRLMTIHGAKGLEAHTVLLLDTCTVAKNPKPLEVLVDWPGRAKAPQIFAFLRSESSAPACVREALIQEREQRAREEINALYVAMTRAKQQLVFCGHEMNKAADPLCPWMRLDALAQADEQAVEEVWHGDFAAPASQSDLTSATASFLTKKMAFAGVESAQAAMNSGVNEELSTAELSASARIGIAMHRLLELYRGDVNLTILLPALTRSLNLDQEQSAQALKAAQTIIQGEAAWVWDENQIDWQANEAEILYEGQLLRLDRLVKHTATQTWWVIDYKSALQPQLQPALREQLQRYRRAVAAQFQQDVKAAFITAQGQLIDDSPMLRG
ncbi:UvrD-helicase domain-containing protein [Variovorax sp. PCZ-1]|uniref:UvrD-helicase domain-containing protein n=1 Tax=Variovorax sp. PCZ-1 TaxID=2835533 RepID=UPI001BD14142|nr:UvrD-helicase domain-containing protein [Variovorax sp. PCZ-1]MBS7808429.1 UvrD-helicase domain-containing protein [Variovorax sp. PCZ-1]